MPQDVPVIDRIDSDHSELERAQTLVGVLRARSELDSDRIAYRFLSHGGEREDTLTFAELDRRARAIAVQLREVAEPGDRALLVYTPGLAYISSFFGCLYAGVVAVPAYPPNPARMARTLTRLQAVSHDARVRVALTSAELLAVAEQLRGQIPVMTQTTWIATDAADDGLAARWSEPKIASTSLAMLQYTSGSTSAPKGVMLTHANLLHNLRYMQKTFGLGRHTHNLNWLPPYHDMGLIGGMLLGVQSGGETSMFSPIEFLRWPLSWLAAMSRLRATVSPAPNFAYELCARKISEADKRGLDLSAWRIALNGSEPVRAETIERFTAAFARCGFAATSMQPAYGLAEGTLLASTSDPATLPVARTFSRQHLELGEVVELARSDPPEEGRVLIGCGQGPPDGFCAIVDPTTLTPTDGVGEIWLSSESVSQGYWAQPEHPAFSARLDGRAFLRSGDLGFVRDGELFITGRLADRIIIRGLNHYPEEIEHEVEIAQSLTRRGCTIALSDPDEEGVIVVCELDRELAARFDDAPPLAELADASRAIRAQLSDVHGLRATEILYIEPGTLPKTTSGKVQRKKCAKAHAEGHLAILHTAKVGVTSLNTGPVGDTLTQILGVSLTPASLAMSLPELGVDSLRLAELAQYVKHHHGLDVDSHDLLGRPLGELLEAIHARASEPPDRPATLVWELAEAEPQLYEHLLAQVPEVAEMLPELRAAIPIPPTNGIFDAGQEFRPEGHFRAYYRRLGANMVIAIKGAEVGCADQVGFLQILHQRPFERYAHYSVTNTLEYFLIQERKVPGALTLPEALNEADKAARLQRSFVERNAEFGAFPVPLFVHRFAPEQVERFARRLRPLLAEHPASILASELERGLACYIYYFPRPMADRVSHYANRLAGEVQRTGQAGLRNTRLIHTTLQADFDPGRVVGAWLDLLAEMLAAGWFPCDTKQFKNGQCIEPQNVLINGALVDMDSVRSFETIVEDREFYEHLLATLNLICRTLRTFLAAEGNGTTTRPPPFPAQFAAPDFLDTLGIIFVWEQLRTRLEREPDLEPRLRELTDSKLSFDVLFNRILYSIYYAGPRFPEDALHLLNVTDAYTSAKQQTGSVTTKISYHAELEVDAAAIATIPRSFLRRLNIPGRDFVDNFLDNQPALISIYDTFLGRIGLIVAALEDDHVYLDRGRTVESVREAIALAARLGASTAALTGLIPSATDYGRALVDANGCVEGVGVTTGHGTTIASCVLMLQRVLTSTGRVLTEEDFVAIGLGSIGAATVELVVRTLPHPRSIALVDLQAKMPELLALRDRLRQAGYRGAIELLPLTGTSVPAPVYERRMIFSATSVANILDVARLRPGTLLIDDSAPHCFDPRLARRRFQTRRDIVFTEAGAISSQREFRELDGFSLSTGWDGHIRAALRLLHPKPEVIMGCVLSSVLTGRFEDLDHTLGRASVDESERHLARLHALKFEGAPLYCSDFVLDAELVELFRAQFGTATK